MKRVFVFVLCLLLLYTSAFAEKYEGIDTFYLEREFDHWNLSETKRESVNGLERVVYTDAKDERRAELTYYEDAVCMALFSEVMCDSKYLEQMFQATMAGESGFIQVMASLYFESHMPAMEDCESYADNIGGMSFRLYRVGDIKGVLVLKDMDTVMALMAPTATAMPAPTSVPTTKPTNMPEQSLCMEKPGIDGSNAYSILISSVSYGLNMGIRQETNDGYAWHVNSETEHGIYTISMDTTEACEICYASFAHSGSDDEFFLWAIAMEYTHEDFDQAAAWIKACQEGGYASTITIGDAIWTYHPHVQKDGGVLTLKDIDCDAYTDYLLDHIG